MSSPRKIEAMAMYDTDFLEWTRIEADKLRNGQLDSLDVANLAEEIESLGKRERSTLVNRLIVPLVHKLKHDQQPERYGRSWELAMIEQRIKITRLLKQNPSLRPLLSEALLDAYESARLKAAIETKLELDRFPELVPTLQETFI